MSPSFADLIITLALMYAALQTEMSPSSSATQTTVMLMMIVALQTAPPPLISAAIRITPLLSSAAAVAASFRHENISVADDRRLPNSTAINAAFCHQHNNIDDDNRRPSKRTPTGHREKNVDATIIIASKRSKKAANIIAASHFDEVLDVVDRYVVIPRPLIHVDQPLPPPLAPPPISPSHRPLASPPISSAPRTPPFRLRLHKKPTFKFKVNKNKSKIKNASLNLINQYKRTTQPKETNYINPHLDSVFTPSNSKHYDDLTNTSSTSTLSSPRLHTSTTLPLSLSNFSNSNQNALESPQTHQIILPFHLHSLDIINVFSKNSNF